VSNPAQTQISQQGQHATLYDQDQRRIEMHLRSTEEQAVSIPGAQLKVRFRKGETIWTESSYKFTPEEVAATARRTEFRCDEQWIDEEWPFAESLLIAE